MSGCLPTFPPSLEATVPRSSGLFGLIDQLAPTKSRILEDFLQRLQELLDAGTLSATLPDSLKLREPELAIRHALQLYDAASVRKLVGNYDPEQSPRILRGSVLKSLRSLGVAKRLEAFEVAETQQAHLLRYQHNLQVSLTRLLGQEVSADWERSWLAGHLENLVVEAPDKVRQFFEERYRELFSAPYWTYLTLKHRYYQGLLLDASSNHANKDRLATLRAGLGDTEQNTDLLNWVNQLDFREMELFVRKARPLLAKQRGTLLPGMKETSETFGLGEPASTGTDASDLNERFKQWLRKHQLPLQRLDGSFSHVLECSAPYFFPQASAYQLEKRDLLLQHLGCQPDESEELPKLIAEILDRDDENALDSRRVEWGLTPETPATDSLSFLLGNHRERSRMHGFRLPWVIRHTAEDSSITLSAGMEGLLHYGLACFGQSADTAPPVQAGVMLRLLVQGTKVGGGTSVVHVGKIPYYAVPLEALSPFRNVLLSALVALLLRHQLRIPASFQRLILRECRMSDALLKQIFQ